MQLKTAFYLSWKVYQHKSPIIGVKSTMPSAGELRLLLQFPFFAVCCICRCV